MFSVRRLLRVGVELGRKMISNRKLYRLGVLVALLMTGFLTYLIYSDVTYAEINGVTVRSRVIGYSDPFYARRELANQILPIVVDAGSTPRKSHFRSAFSRQNGYKFISMDNNFRKTSKVYYEDDETTVNSIYNKPNHPQQDIDAISSKHSNQKRHTTQGIPSYLNNKAKGQHIDSSKNYNDNNTIYSKSRSSYSAQDKAISNISHSSTPSPDVKVSHPVNQDQNMKNTKSSSVNSGGETKNGKKYLVYLCDSSSWCGGWGDRQRGIASSYHFSKLIGREFKIVMNTPCNLTQFYRPSKHNWVLVPDEIAPSARRIVMNSISNDHVKNKIKEGYFNLIYPHDVIFMKTNQDLVKAAEGNPVYSERIKKDSNLSSKRSKIRSAWRDLMQPTDYILSQLQQLVGSERLIRKGLITKPLENIRDTNKTNHSLTSLNVSSPNSPTVRKSLNTSSSLSTSPSKPLICAHVRMGKNPTIPMDEQFDSFKLSDIPKLLRFLKSKDTKHDAEFFLATDFEGIRGSFVQFFGDKLLQHGGRIIHIDRQRRVEDACLGFGVALLDQLVLSICDQLVVSRSGFSMHASYVSNNSQPSYIMEDGIIKTFVN